MFFPQGILESGHPHGIPLYPAATTLLRESTTTHPTYIHIREIERERDRENNVPEYLDPYYAEMSEWRSP